MSKSRRHPAEKCLLVHHRALIDASSISPEVAEARGYRSVESISELRRLGFADAQCSVPTLLIPIRNVHGEIALYQSRPDTPRMTGGRAVKYETPRGATMTIDVPPTIRDRMRDPSWPLFITEGIRKADSAVSHGLCCIALLGVWNWRGTNEFGGKIALPDWESIALNGREIFIVFDSDVTCKPQVHGALVRLEAFLESRGAKVKIVLLPEAEGGSKVGLDDFLASGGDIAALVSEATSEIPSVSSDDDRDPDDAKYKIESGRVWARRQTRDGVVWISLSNFSAFVHEELALDNGVEESRAFEIGGFLQSGEPLPKIRVPVEQFSAMGWVPQKWGLRAAVSAGLGARDQLREAIQLLSPEAGLRRVFTHTGWRKVDDRWVYLTSGGAVGMEGIEVDLGAELTRYSLPTTPIEPAEAMKLSLKLLRVAPLRITAPLFAGTFRAPLATARQLDVALWLEGKTGSLKSSLAACFQSHWGEFERTTLPGDWRSTANLLEKHAFTLKDAMFVVDEYVPMLERREFEQKAARVIRAQGNLSGRGRLRSDLTTRPSFYPRGLIIGTGEEHPSGRSVLARTLVIELQRQDVNLERLSEIQAAKARLPHAQAGYVEWLAPQMDSLAQTLLATFTNLRARAGEHGHLRIPEVLAHLGIGLDCGLAYAVEVGACSESEASELRQACWAEMVQLAREQGRMIEEERPSRRFLEVLNTLLVQAKVQLPHKDLSCMEADQGTPIGWKDADYMYLIPDAAYRAVAQFAREANDPFPTSKSRLMLDLAQEGISEPAPGRSTASVRIQGRVHRVLRLKQKAVATVLGEAEPETEGVTAVTAVTAPGE